MRKKTNNTREAADYVKLCFVCPKAYPLFNPDVQGVFGGAEVDLYYIGTELAKDAGFDVSFVTADYGQPDIEVRENVRIIKSLTFDECAPAGAAKVWRAMREADAEIYMMKSESGVLLVAFFCWLKGRTFVYRTARSAHCDGTYIRDHPFIGRLFKWAVGKAKVVLTQNERDKANLNKNTGIGAIVIKNGHRIRENLELERKIILWVGRSADTKRPFMFIKLAEGHPSERFVMICQRAMGDDKYYELPKKATQVENLQFIERAPFNEISSYFERAKVFVNTSEAEGFPNTFIQACLARTPILSLNVNPDDFLDKYKCGICAVDNWKKFVDGLRILLDADTARQYGENGLEYVKQNHDITKIIAEYKKLFFNIAAKP